MTNRYSREDKGKGLSEHSRQRRKPPVRIPAEDNEALIAEYNLTLIGRVTNPAAQNTKALVDFFLQHWHVGGTITGRDLGPNLVQFNFETEQDLQSVLSKAPFHFKRWMLLLERWKPIVSDRFPAMIPFWIQVYGIPLHFWTLKTLDTIGEELGKVEAKDLERGRIRVLINGLNPLEMKMDISLSSGEITQVEFNYEKLEKHCFHCFALTHEKKDCPLLPPDKRSSSSNLGISQLNTLDRLEANRRRGEERRPPKSVSPRNKDWRRKPSHSQNRSSDRVYASDYVRRDDRRSYDSRENYGRDRTSLTRKTYVSAHSRSENQRIHTSRHPAGPAHLSWKPVTETANQKTPTRSLQSQVSHTPSPRPQREAILPTSAGSAKHSEDVQMPISGDRRSALERLSAPHQSSFRTAVGQEIPTTGELSEAQLQHSEERRSALNRLSTPLPPAGHLDALQTDLTTMGRPSGTQVLGSGDRRPALERLSGQPSRVPLLHNGVANVDSGRLQEVNIQYLEDSIPPISGGFQLGTSSRAPAFNFGTIQEAFQGSSPIRSLSEDRIHVALRLGPVITESAEESGDDPVMPASQRPMRSARIALKAAKAAKTAGKKKLSNQTANPETRKRVTLSPLQGVSLKKRRVTKNSPVRRITGSGTHTTTALRGKRPSTTINPATIKRGTDFRTVPGSLP